MSRYLGTGTVLRRLAPLGIGVAVAVGLAGVAALALPGVGSAVVVDEPEAEERITELTDPAERATGSVAAAGKVTPGSSKATGARARGPSEAERRAIAARQAERIAAMKAKSEAARTIEERAAKEAAEREAAERKAAEREAAEREAAKQAARREAQAEQAAERERATRDKDAERADERSKDASKDGTKEGRADEGGKGGSDAWWPSHVGAHAHGCSAVDLEAGSVTATWDVWLKHGGGWSFASASPSAESRSWHGDDKLRLVYAARTASIVKQHDGWSKATAGRVSVTVAKRDEPGTTKTFEVDLWVKVDSEGNCL